MKNKHSNLDLPQSTLIKNQSVEIEKTINHEGRQRDMVVKIRHDDECGNGHNTFAITADIYTKDRRDDNAFISGGCIRDEIAKHFPELKKYIKWHLCSTDEPMYYVENTTYHASDKDCHGLRKGEKKQIRIGNTDRLAWKLAVKVGDEYRSAKVEGVGTHVNSEKQPESPSEGLCYIPWCREGEGKEPDLEAARSCAIWPDATLEQLQDKEALLERLPALMREFKADVEELGFTY